MLFPAARLMHPNMQPDHFFGYLDPMQPMPQSICAYVCAYVCFGPTQRLLPGVTRSVDSLLHISSDMKSFFQSYTTMSHPIVTVERLFKSSAGHFARLGFLICNGGDKAPAKKVAQPLNKRLPLEHHGRGMVRHVGEVFETSAWFIRERRWHVPHFGWDLRWICGELRFLIDHNITWCGCTTTWRTFVYPIIQRISIFCCLLQDSHTYHQRKRVHWTLQISMTLHLKVLFLLSFCVSWWFFVGFEFITHFRSPAPLRILGWIQTFSRPLFRFPCPMWHHFAGSAWCACPHPTFSNHFRY